MRPLKVAILLMVLLIVSSRGLPTYETETDYQKRIELSAAETDVNYQFPRGIGIEPLATSTGGRPSYTMTVQTRPPTKVVVNNKPPLRWTVENTPPPRWVLENRPPLRVTNDNKPLPERFQEQLESRTLSSTTTTEAALLTSPHGTTPTTTTTSEPPSTTKDGEIGTDALGPRNRRAVLLRVPRLRLPSLTRLRPHGSVPRSPGARLPPTSFPQKGPKLGVGPPPRTSPDGGSISRPLEAGSAPGSTPKGGSKSGPLEAGAPPPADKKLRRKGGSKSGSGSLPDLDDLPSPGGLSDFFGGDSAPGDGVEKTRKSKEEETVNKTTTTERNKKKWDRPHFHPEGPGHFPDYDFGWHEW